MLLISFDKFLELVTDIVLEQVLLRKLIRIHRVNGVASISSPV